MSRDPRSTPRVGWRVAWQVCAGAPGTALCRLARSPQELLHDAAQRPHHPHIGYYATRALLPPLHRCLSLLGVHVTNWSVYRLYYACILRIYFTLSSWVTTALSTMLYSFTQKIPTGVPMTWNPAFVKLRHICLPHSSIDCICLPLSSTL